MAEQKEQKRAVKPGFRRVVVTLAEADYKALVETAEAEMREPNNMLSFALNGRINDVLAAALD
jgi:hypothetical protein